MGRVLAISKTVLVVLGLLAIATATPLLLVGSLAADAALRVVEIGRAIRDKNGMKALIQFCVLASDVFALAAILTGSWPLMVAAAGICVIAMLVIAGLAYKKGYSFEAVCFIALAALGITGMVRIEEAAKNPHSDTTNATAPNANTTYSGIYTRKERAESYAPLMDHPEIESDEMSPSKAEERTFKIPAFKKLHEEHYALMKDAVASTEPARINRILHVLKQVSQRRAVEMRESPESFRGNPKLEPLFLRKED